jgi:hypothetical protein
VSEVPAAKFDEALATLKPLPGGTAVLANLRGIRPAAGPAIIAGWGLVGTVTSLPSARWDHCLRLVWPGRRRHGERPAAPSDPGRALMPRPGA